MFEINHIGPFLGFIYPYEHFFNFLGRTRKCTLPSEASPAGPCPASTLVAGCSPEQFLPPGTLPGRSIPAPGERMIWETHCHWQPIGAKGLSGPHFDGKSMVSKREPSSQHTSGGGWRRTTTTMLSITRHQIRRCSMRSSVAALSKPSESLKHEQER